MKFWQRGYIYVASVEGEEIPGSRRYLSSVMTAEEYGREWDALAAQMGEGCTVRHADEGEPA